ncbi:MAG: hypothetical protein HRU36_05810 [Rickettsiales bacterium]|nr:hypothetical protein [Rickettsiales bacterium]
MTKNLSTFQGVYKAILSLYNLDKYEEALTLQNQAKELAISVDYQVVHYRIFANIYIGLKNLEKALENIEQAKVLMQSSEWIENHSKPWGEVLATEAQIHFLYGNIYQAIDAMQVATSQEVITPTPQEQGANLQELGYFLYEVERYKEAYDACVEGSALVFIEDHKCLDIIKNIGDINNIAEYHEL